MIALQPDEPAGCEPVVGVRGELARGDARLPVRALELVLDDLAAIQPVLDMVALHEQARFVPMIERVHDTGGRRIQREVGAGGRETALAVLGIRVIEQLVLRRAPVDVVVLARAAVEDTAVAGLANLPLELELEVAEGLP